MIRCGVMAVAGEHQARACALAESLSLPLLPTSAVPAHCDDVDGVLLVGDQPLALQATGRGAPGPVAADFGTAAMRHRRRGGQNELLGRAAGVAGRPGLPVLDATGGLGRDAFVLADLGCRVRLCERHPVLAAMLASALAGAASSEDPWLREVAGRMRLEACDARDLDGPEFGEVAVIYLDPMFPERRKRAAVKKDLALLQRLLGQADDTAEADRLLDWALARDVARVVVKRPPSAPPLAGLSPSHQLGGKAVRFDVYVRRALP